MDISTILSNFKIEGELVSIKSNKEGHINSTYISTFNHNGRIKKYTHQKINKIAFKNPEKVMQNIVSITTHIQSKVQNFDNKELRALNVIFTNDNKPFFIDDNDDYWRTYDYIDNVTTYNKVTNKDQAYHLGIGVATFQQQLRDFDGSTLFDTITDFHNMRYRYDNLKKAIKNNSFSRVEKVKEELDFLLKNEERGYIIWDEFKSGILPLRVTHNDTKINNVLFNKEGNEALCVIDLDTVMGGTILFDTGDMIRTATSTLEEDTLNYKDMECNVEYFKELIAGYKSISNSFLNDRENELLLESGRNITQIMGVRFLTDYLEGDKYYTISRENHNLDRARTQIALMKDFDKKWDLLSQAIK